MKRQVEIEDNLNEIIDGCKDDLKDLVIDWLNDILKSGLYNIIPIFLII